MTSLKALFPALPLDTMISPYTIYELAPFVVTKSLVLAAASFLVLSAALLLRAAAHLWYTV